jgi:hypothetical protein
MSTNRLTITTDDEVNAVITSNDDKIKQVFFGWADDGKNAPFYGQSIAKVRSMSGGHDMWRWTLSAEMVETMLRNLTTGIGISAWSRAASPEEKKANTTVLRELKKWFSNDTQFEPDEFTAAYLVAALWSTNDNGDESGGQPLDANYGIGDIADEAMRSAMESCAEFQEEHEELLAKAYELYTPRDGSDGPALAGHDLWLNSNGHGVGFSDRGLGEIGEALSKAAVAFGDRDIYVGDDGLIHGF